MCFVTCNSLAYNVHIFNYSSIKINIINMKIELLGIFKLGAQQNQLIDWALFFVIITIASLLPKIVDKLL